jgi:ectoine hydroxylase-related dioxygenase (phytanoyl-CoA dioxygenase family)
MDDQLLQQYKSQGFCLIRNVFGHNELEDMRRGCDELVAMASNLERDTHIGRTYFCLHRDANPFDARVSEKEVHKGLLRRVTYPYATSAIFNKYRVANQLLNLIKGILGQNLVQIVNQVNFNHPQLGTGWGWHQDYRFRKPGIEDLRTNYVQSLIALDRCSPETGGLRLIPQSDQLQLKLDEHFDDAESFFDASKAVCPEIEPGDVVCFNPYVIHGSTPNTSKNQRRVYINGYANGDRCTHGLPVMSQGRVIESIEGQMEYEGELNVLPTIAKY